MKRPFEEDLKRVPTQACATPARCPSKGWQQLVGACTGEESECDLREIRSSAVLGRITRGLAHQLANELATVQGVVELIGVLPASDPTRPLQLAQKALDEAFWLLKQVRNSAEPTLARPRSSQLGPALEDVAGLMGQINRSRLSVRLEVEETLPEVSIDQVELHEALTILFTDCIQKFFDVNVDLRSATLQIVVRGEHLMREPNTEGLVGIELAFFPGRAWERERIISAQPLAARRVELTVATPAPVSAPVTVSV